MSTDCSLGEQRILFSSNLNVSLDYVSGNKIHCSPRNQSVSVNYPIKSHRKLPNQLSPLLHAKPLRTAMTALISPPEVKQ